jgi:polyisoprenoid-binding protein YceI
MSLLEQQLPTGTWTIDPIHSSASFAVKHSLIATFRGGFRELEATLSTVDGEPVLTGVVPVASVDVRDENLSGHLLSPDFFDAERHPEITFVSTAVRPGGDGAVIVEGDLTLKGHTQRVEASGVIAGPAIGVDGNERLGIELTAVVDRASFGLDWNAPLPSGALVLGNDVTLTVALELTRADA